MATWQQGIGAFGWAETQRCTGRTAFSEERLRAGTEPWAACGCEPGGGKMIRSRGKWGCGSPEGTGRENCEEEGEGLSVLNQEDGVQCSECLSSSVSPRSG